MPTKVGRHQFEKNPVPTGTLNSSDGTTLSYHAHRWAVNEMLPMIKKRMRATVRANPRPWDFYQRLPSGVRCSCWGLNDTPDGYCASCFGTGWVGGYEKYGFKTVMLDAASDLRMVNVLPDRKQSIAPIPLALIKTAVRGSVEMSIPLMPNAGIVDTFKVYQSTPTNTSVAIFVRNPTEELWTPATVESIQARLHGGVLLLRAELTRKTPDDRCPYLRAIRLRYQLLTGQTRVFVNFPLGEDMLAAQEFGIVETFTGMTLILDDTVKAVNPLDFFYDPINNRKWIVQSSRNNNPYGHTVYWHLQARLLQPFDTVAEFPL